MTRRDSFPARLSIRPSLLYRLLLMGVVCVLVLSCIGPQPPKGKILIEFWDFPRLPAVSKWLEEAIDKYEQENPDVHVEFTRLSWGKGGERLDIAAFAGRAPDVAGAVLQIKYVEAGLLAPVDEYLDEPISPDSAMTYRQDIHPGVLRAVQWDNAAWSFPWYKEGFVIVLNDDILRERGVTPPPEGRWTWDEFLATMEQLTFDRDGDGKTDVYGIGFNTGPQKWEAYSFLFAEGMEILSEDGRTCLINSDATRRGINRLLQMEYDAHVSLPNAGGIQDDTTWQAFSGKERFLASTCQGLWCIRAVDTMNGRLEEFVSENPGKEPPTDPLSIHVALYPQMPGQPQRMASYGVGSLMVFKRPGDSERTREAAKFARYLTLEAGQQINREAGLLPSRISTGNLFEDDPRYRDIWPYLPDAASPPNHPVWPQLDQVINDNLQLILLRRISLDEGVTRMGERCQYILDAYWKSKDAAID